MKLEEDCEINSKFNFDKKHPVLLQVNHPLTVLQFRKRHVNLLHAGPQHLLSEIREQFWPISGRSTAKTIVRNSRKTSSSHSVNAVDLPS